MLIKCPECDLQASDKAQSCPHCGYPLQSDSKIRQPRKTNKKRRLPNGFGQISEIKGRNLRNPFRAMVTVGKTPSGRPICKPLKPNAFFPTYNDAYAALVEYNKNPYDLGDSITVKELYEKWSSEHFGTLGSDSTVRGIVSAWAYCSDVYDMKVSELRSRHIKGCMNEGYVTFKTGNRYATPNMKSRIKSLFNNMLDYAVEYEIVDRNYARSFNLPDDVQKEVVKVKKLHIPFEDYEMKLLWENLGKVDFVDVVLIQCYSGWRPQELGLLQVKDVDIKNWTFLGGMKSDAGTDRIVPIHSKIKELVKARYDEAVSIKSPNLINCTDGYARLKDLTLTYSKYKERFARVRESLNLNPKHRPHDPRKHFVTKAKHYNVDEYAIKYMIGHVIQDVTERVYTERTMDWLRTEVEKIK